MDRMQVIYNKYTSGDSITDAELLEGVTFFSELTENLFRIGPTFHLAFMEANRISDWLTTMARNRGLIKY